MSNRKRHEYTRLEPDADETEEEDAVQYELEDRSANGTLRTAPPASFHPPRSRPTKAYRKLGRLQPRQILYALLGFAFVLLAFWWIPPNEFSTRNDLLFLLSAPNGPMRQWGYTEWVSLTAGVTPKRIHSHNDYEQPAPLLKALSYGAASVEADVWLVEDELLVGHTESELSSNRTLSSLYLDPLQDIIRVANLDREDDGVTRLRGVFDTAPKLPLQLLIDLKTDGSETFNKLYEYLDPLRSAGYLTTVVPASPYPIFSPSVVTVIGTGNTLLSSVLELGNNSARMRDIFLDAQLSELVSPNAALRVLDAYKPSVSPLASANLQDVVGWSWVAPWVARRRVRTMVNAAHEKGIQARFWNTPSSPVWFRNLVWQMLLDEGADWLNADDLPAAARF